MPGSGNLANRVRFDVRGPDANGDPLGPWVEGMTVWAQVKWLRGGETAVSERLEGRQPAVLVIRTSTAARALTTAHRAVAISGRDVTPEQVFNLTSISAAAERGFIDVLGVTGGAGG